MRLLICTAILLACAGCQNAATDPARGDPILREAREKLTYQGKPILPYFLNDFAGGPGAPDYMTEETLAGWGTRICAVAVDGLLSEDHGGAYGGQKTRHLHGFYCFDHYENPSDPTHETYNGYFGYRFVGTTPGGTTVLEYLVGGSGSMIIQGVLLVRFDMEQAGVTPKERHKRLVMRFLQEMSWGDRVERDVRLEGNRLVLGTTRPLLPGFDVESAETIPLE